ncbi:MAG: Gfo/Idh/MocA family oxidoreductase [Planctomycetia bacterium]|nr:Gfo/Idh/MocA family oxidoreductase [Planctomycetia bacterium]
MSHYSKNMTRRRFLATSAAVSTVSLISAFPAPALIAAGANNAIRVGVIGLGVRGRNHSDILGGLPDAKIVALAEPDPNRLGEREEKFKTQKAFTDMRRIIEDPNVDAVTIATCNHWHALAGIWAMEAGKDVYVEKPLALSTWECRQLVKVARKYGRICQVGTQARSDKPYHEAVQKFLHEEKALGKILFARANRFFPRRPIGKRTEPLDVRDKMDYNLWLGPAKDVPIYRDRLHYDWHWMWNTGNGETGNWGSHLLDNIRNDVLQDRVVGPKRILSLGGRLGPEDAGETPNTMITWFETDVCPIVLSFSGVEPKGRRHYTGRFQGPDSGYLVCCEGGYIHKEMVDAIAYDNAGKEICRFPAREFYGGAPHFVNFLQAIRSRKAEDLNCDIQVGFDDALWYNSANTAYRLGKEYKREAFLETVGKSSKTAEILVDIEQHVADIGETVDSLRVSPILELDSVTGLYTGENAVAANTLMNYRPARNEFVVPEV